MKMKTLSLKELKDIAKELFELQKSKNGGKGLSWIRWMYSDLNFGLIEKAWSFCSTHAFEICEFSDIRKFLREKLFQGVNERDPIYPPQFRSEFDHIYDKV